MKRKMKKKSEPDTIWDVLGITVERYDAIESTLLSALVLKNTKTDVIDDVLKTLKNEEERRAFEVILLSYCDELLPLKLLSSIGLMPGKVITTKDLKEMDCNNPNCPVHGKKGGEKHGRQKTGKTSDPMVA